MATIDKNLIQVSLEEVQDQLIDMLNRYNFPSFGSMSKRDIDISIFMLMQNLGIIKMNPQIYEVVSLLHITSSKARNLIYEASLRRNTIPKLDDALFELLKSPVFLTTSDNMIALEIDDPLLIDHLKQKLRDLKFVTDGSFNRGLVKMSINAYATLFDVLLSPEIREKLFPDMNQFPYDEEIELTGNDNIESRSKKVLNWCFKKSTSVVLEKGVEKILPTLHEKLAHILEMNNIGDFISWLKEL